MQRRAADQSRFTEIDFEAKGDGLTPAQEEEQAARRYGALAALCDAAIARKDNTSLQPLLRSAGEAHRLLYAIRENKASYEERMQHLIPYASAVDLLRSRIEPVKAALEAMPKQLAYEIDPINPGRVEDILEAECKRILRTATELSGA